MELPDDDLAASQKPSTPNHNHNGQMQMQGGAKKSTLQQQQDTGDEDTEAMAIATLLQQTNKMSLENAENEKKIDRDGDDDHAADPGRIYEPFPLKPTSSFAPGTVSPRQLSRMDPRLRAKYQAYTTPAPSLQVKISASEKRARKWMHEEHKRLEIVHAEEKRKWDLLHRAIEDPAKKAEGQKLAMRAHRRILHKKTLFRHLREKELQYLVEGQSNSIDAIQLKEFLVPFQTSVEPEYTFTAREKARLEELVSMKF